MYIYLCMHVFDLPLLLSQRFSVFHSESVISHVCLRLSGPTGGGRVAFDWVTVGISRRAYRGVSLRSHASGANLIDFEVLRAAGITAPWILQINLVLPPFLFVTTGSKPVHDRFSG